MPGESGREKKREREQYDDITECSCIPFQMAKLTPEQLWISNLGNLCGLKADKLSLKWLTEQCEITQL